MINTSKPASMDAEEITAWEAKDKHGRKIVKKSYPIDESDPEGPADDFFMVEPSRTAVEAISDLSQKRNTTKQINELTLNSSLLAGPIEKLLTDNALYYGVLGDVSNLGQVKKSR